MKEDFLRVLLTLQPYLSHLMIIGGWAVYVYHYYYYSSPPSGIPLGTMDIDFAAVKSIPLQGSKSIDQLLVGAGFQRILGFDTNPPACKYISNSSEFEIEFIANLKGHEQKLTEDIQAGLGAQKLRYINILSINCIKIKIIDELLNGDKVDIEIRVAHPGRFVFQKILASKDHNRSVLKSNKDIYYAYDLIANYQDLYIQIVEEICSLKAEFSSWHKKFIKILSKLFKSELSDGPSILLSQRPIADTPNHTFIINTYRKMRKFIQDVK